MEAAWAIPADGRDRVEGEGRRFIIVGGGPVRRAPGVCQLPYEQAAQLGLSKRIIWAGYRDDVADLMHAMDVLVHPAEQEPLGRVVLGAMCMGTPSWRSMTAGQRS